MNFEPYVLVGSTVRSYLAWLKDTGRINAIFENNMLLWEQAKTDVILSGPRSCAGAFSCPKQKEVSAVIN